MTISTTPAQAVSAVMHHGVIHIPPQATLQEAAAEMAEQRVHCVVVEGLARGRDRQETLVWGILSDLDLVKAIASERLDTAVGDLAATEIVTVEEAETIERAAQLMAEHDCTHLVVVAPSGAPVGVISSLDVACAATWPGSMRSV
ncbi:MAG TPA: CBS domain-containing protein [Solirubrobacteraceae bacterium]|nr:CBS domain-containing protein [Solirubrobacteraceae bacterium]